MTSLEASNDENDVSKPIGFTLLFRVLYSLQDVSRYSGQLTDALDTKLSGRQQQVARLAFMRGVRYIRAISFAAVSQRVLVGKR